MGGLWAVRRRARAPRGWPAWSHAQGSNGRGQSGCTARAPPHSERPPSHSAPTGSLQTHARADARKVIHAHPQASARGDAHAYAHSYAQFRALRNAQQAAVDQSSVPSPCPAVSLPMHAPLRENGVSRGTLRAAPLANHSPPMAVPGWMMTHALR
eukprot:3846171-Pleurochrysis_carterae.AAC.1